jgi:DNA repair protein RadD
MTYILRPYQAQAVERGTAFLTGGATQGGLIVLPTGAGKSLVIAGIAKALDAPCLIFQPTREILEQNATKLLAYGFEPAVFSASMNEKRVGQITLATIGSVKTRPDLFDAFPYVMIDEAHGVNPKAGMYAEFLSALGDVRILGLTATPYRLNTDGYGGSMLKFLTRTRPRVFSEVVAYAQISELIQQGYLVQPQYQHVPGFDRAALVVNTTGADYTDASVKRQFNRIGFADRLRRVVVRLLEIQRKNVLVFTRFIDEAEALAAAVPGVAVLMAYTPPKKRAEIVAGFRAGAIKVIANVGVLGIGFDYPELETVVLARPTVSLGLYYQQVGRLLRPHPAKTSAWVVDMVDQVKQFGPIEDLWLQPGGWQGQQWEVVSRRDGQERALTNQYFAQSPGQQWSRRRRWQQR